MVSLYLGALVNHLLFTFGGVVLMIFAIIEKLRKKDTEAWIFWGAAIACIFIACYGAWVDEHNNASAVIVEKADAWSRYNSCSSGLKEKEAEVTGWNNRFSDQVGRAATLQNTINSQQSTFDLCVTTLSKANAPIQQSTTMFVVGDIVANPAAKHSIRYVLLTNKSVSPVKLILWCDGTIKAANIRTLSGSPFSGGVSPLSSGALFVPPKMWQINLAFPVWSPEQPIVLQLDYDVDDLGSCVIKS